MWTPPGSQVLLADGLSFRTGVVTTDPGLNGDDLTDSAPLCSRRHMLTTPARVVALSEEHSP